MSYEHAHRLFLLSRDKVLNKNRVIKDTQKQPMFKKAEPTTPKRATSRGPLFKKEKAAPQKRDTYKGPMFKLEAVTTAQKRVVVKPTSSPQEYQPIVSWNSKLDYICEPDGPTYTSDTTGLIVTMTSWQKRIGNVAKTVKTILENTMRPEKIIINLATEEFPGKEKDLPKELLELVNNNSIVEIYWLKHNTTVWKKTIPTLMRFKKAMVICVDDDALYPKTFIKTFYDKALVIKDRSLTGANVSFMRGIKQHCGCASLDRYSSYGNGLNFINDKVMELKSSDTVLTVISARMGHENAYLGTNYLSVAERNNPVNRHSAGMPSLSKVALSANTLFDEFNKTETRRKELLQYAMFPENSTIAKKEDKIIVSMTSYKKRINVVYDVVKSILENTLVPDKIICNLSTDEFPKKEEELPQKLVDLQKNGIFEINWVKENVRQFKKIIPTLEKYPKDVIISIDDDVIYNKQFVQLMYAEYLKWGKQCPITTGSYLWPNNVYSHNGGGTLVTADMFGGYLHDIYYNFARKIILENKIKVFDDPLYTYTMLLSGKRYKFIRISSTTIANTETITHAGNQTYRANIFHWHDLIKDYIKTKYGKTYDDMLKAPIIVNFTTWKKRESVVPGMLKTIHEQTLKPDKVIAYLSEEEYGRVAPSVIKQMKEKGYITDIEWVPGNTYSHKRWEAMKKYYNCYNIFVDDDIYYDKNYVKDLFNTAVLNQGCDIIWTSQIEEIRGTQRSHPLGNDATKSKKLQTLSGMSCLPPFTFPIESFKYTKNRDKWCTKCDDSWNRAWLIKNNIDIVRVHDRHKVPWKGIPDTESSGIWQENKQKVNGIELMMTHFANALICANATSDAKAIWPQFDIYKCCNKELLAIINYRQ